MVSANFTFNSFTPLSRSSSKVFKEFGLCNAANSKEIFLEVFTQANRSKDDFIYPQKAASILSSEDIWNLERAISVHDCYKRNTLSNLTIALVGLLAVALLVSTIAEAILIPTFLNILTTCLLAVSTAIAFLAALKMILDRLNSSKKEKELNKKIAELEIFIKTHGELIESAVDQKLKESVISMLTRKDTKNSAVLPRKVLNSLRSSGEISMGIELQNALNNIQALRKIFKSESQKIST